MNSTMELLRSHRSIRKYTDEAVDQATVRAIIACAQSAASSSNVQATTVIQVHDVETRHSIAEVAGGQTWVETAAVFLVWCADLRRSGAACAREGGAFEAGMTEHFIIATVDVALAAQNAAIAAESLGLGICYIGGIRNDPTQVSRLLELPEQVYPVFGFCIGHPAQDPELKPRLSLDAVLMQDRYDESERDAQIDEYDRRLSEYYATRTGGNKRSSWSEEMRKLVGKESRPHMRSFLAEQGFTMR